LRIEIFEYAPFDARSVINELRAGNNLFSDLQTLLESNKSKGNMLKSNKVLSKLK